MAPLGEAEGQLPVGVEAGRQLVQHPQPLYCLGPLQRLHVEVHLVRVRVRGEGEG